MNGESAICDICHAQAPPREWLSCMLCGQRFHFYRERTSGEDCGIIGPNPASNGC